MCQMCGSHIKLKNKKCAVGKNKTSLRWLSERAVIPFRLVSKNLLFMSINLIVSWSLSSLACNGRNYMQLGIAGCFPVEPHNRCCGLRTLLSAPKPQLTYSFCYAQVIYSFWVLRLPYFQFQLVFFQRPQ